MPVVVAGAVVGMLKVEIFGESKQCGGHTICLTTDADEIIGTSGNDTINGGVGTLSGADIIDGGAGTDTLTVRMDGTGPADTMGIVSNVENITIIARTFAGAASFADVTGVETVTLKDGTVDFDLTFFDVDTKLVLQNSDDTYGVAFASLSADADELDVTVNGYTGNLEIDTTGLESVKITATGDESEVDLEDHATATIETITIVGDADITLIQNAATDALTAIDASAATGAVEISLGATTNLAITLGSGDDTVNAATFLNSNDSITGGEGDDTVVAELAGTTVRPTMSGVENLELEFANAGTTFDMRNITGATTVTLTGDETSTLTRVAASVATINIEEAASTENYSVTYATGANSAVTVNVGAANDDGDAVVAAGTIDLVGNAGALVINSIGDDDNSAGNITANDAASLTINASEVGLSLGANDISATDATAFTVNATAGDVAFDDATLTAATAIALNATGGAIAAGDLTSGEDGVAVTVVASGSDDNDVSIDLIDADFATSFDFTATGGADITVTDIETLGEDSDGDDIDNEINITANGEGSTVAVTIDAFAAAGIVDLVTLVSDADGTVSFTIGAGTNVTVSEVDATGSAGTTTIDLSGVTAASEVSTGAGGSTTTLTTGADLFVGGSGDDSVTGGDGADDITLGAGSDTVVLTTAVTADTVQDFNTDDDLIQIEVDNIGSDLVNGNGDSLAADATVTLQSQTSTALNDIAVTTQILVFTDSLANATAMQTAVEALSFAAAGTPTDDDDILVLWTDGTDTFLSSVDVLITTDAIDTAVNSTLVTLIGVDIADVTAGNFEFI